MLGCRGVLTLKPLGTERTTILALRFSWTTLMVEAPHLSTKWALAYFAATLGVDAGAIQIGKLIH